MAVIRKPKKKIAERQIELRKQLWPFTADETYLWNRNTSDGFATIPRTLPIIMAIMDDMADGKRVSSTYLELWCRVFDESIVNLSKGREMAAHAGFDGQRADRSWRERMTKLQDLRFIEIAGGASGPMSHALIYNPYRIIRWHHDVGTPGLSKEKYAALYERALEIGADDIKTPLSFTMASPPQEPAVAPEPPATPAPATTPETPVSADAS